jgi:hypothetical protein
VALRAKALISRPGSPIDAQTGILAGTPDVAGDVEVAVAAVAERDVRTLDEKILAWGNEKVLSARVENVEIATQKFILSVK